MKRWLGLAGWILIIAGLGAVLAEVLGFSLLIYYGNPLGGFLGIGGIFLGVLFLTIVAVAGEMRGLNFMERYVKFVDTYNELVGLGVGWFTTVMVVVVFVNVVLRYAYGQSFLQLQDMSWYVFGIVFMIGAAYTLKDDRHVRVDVVYVNLPPRVKVWVNLLGSLLFLVPFCILGIYVSWEFVERSYLVQETSPDAGGLAARYLAKAVIPIGFVLIFFQGISLLFTSILQLQGKLSMGDGESGGH